MTTLDIALAQIPVTEGAFAENRERIHRIVETHGPAQDLIVFPETCLSGFARRDEVLASAEPLTGPTVTGLCALARKFDTSLLLGLAERADDGVYNTAVFIGPDGLLGSYRKTQLWKAERDIFHPGNTLRVVPWRGLCVGLLICYDIEFPEPARALARLGADLILVANSNMVPYGPAHLRAACARAQENQVFLAMANRVGQGRDDLFAGESMVVGPDGEPLLRLDSREAVRSIRIDTSQVEACRVPYHYLRDLRSLAGSAPVLLVDGGKELQLAPLTR